MQHTFLTHTSVCKVWKNEYTRVMHLPIHILSLKMFQTSTKENGILLEEKLSSCSNPWIYFHVKSVKRIPGMSSICANVASNDIWKWTHNKKLVHKDIESINARLIYTWIRQVQMWFSHKKTNADCDKNKCLSNSIVEHMWNPPLVINKWINKNIEKYFLTVKSTESK